MSNLWIEDDAKKYFDGVAKMENDFNALRAENAALKAQWDSVPWMELYYAHDALQNERQRKHDMRPHGQLVVDYAPALNKFIDENYTLVRSAFDANAPKEADSE